MENQNFKKNFIIIFLKLISMKNIRTDKNDLEPTQEIIIEMMKKFYKEFSQIKVFIFRMYI